jgi:hypothetical protein
MVYHVHMDTKQMIENEWGCILSLLPSDLDESAAAKLALVRRREIRCASDLLRLAFAYALCDFSLDQTAAWAALVGIGKLSSPAVFKRLCQAETWLGYLLLQWLREHGLTASLPPLDVRVLDATVVSGPGSRGTDWRVHLGLDLAHSRISTAELTGPEGGETLLRHHIEPGQIALADRGYGHREGVVSVLQQQGHVVVRIGCHNFPLETTGGQPVELPAWMAILRVGEIGDWQVQFRTHNQAWPVRLIALRKTQAAAEQEQARLQHEATRKGRRPDPDSLKAAHFVILITDLSAPQLSATDALELYRLRWQIEMCFKRLKGILHLDHLRAQTPTMARSYLYAKLLGALVVDELCHRAVALFPWGYPISPAGYQSMAFDEATA